VGDSALAANQAGGNKNTAVGISTLANNTTGSSNSAFGRQALASTTTGGANTAVGVDALVSSTTASNNTAVGYQAGYSGTTASDSTYLGQLAGYGATTGTRNTLVGFYTGSAITTGTFNNFFGTQAGQAVTTGGKNTILGSYSGNQSGLDIRTSSNYIVLSDGDGNPNLYLDSNKDLFVPKVYVSTTGSAANVFVTSAGQIIRSTASSARFKENITDWSGEGLAEILKLKPRTFTYKADYYSQPNRVVLGLIAEEVEAVSPFLVDFENEDGTGQVENVRYANIVVPLIKAIQELKAELDTAKAQIAALQGA
jgi:hypothetical protein